MYSATSPYSQGSQGALGATQTPKPNFQPQQRGALWQPPPSSTTSRPKTMGPQPMRQPAQMQSVQSYGGSGSPVNPDGTIKQSPTPQAQPQQLSQPQAPAQQAPTPWTTEDFNAGRMDIDPGRGWSGQEWVDFYNTYRPRTATPQPAPPGAQPSAPTPQQAAVPGFESYFRQIQSQQAPLNVALDPYRPQQLTTQAPQGYQAATVGQFQAPNQQLTEQQQQALLSQILANPHSLSATTIEQIKEAQKSGALSMQQQLQGQMQQAAAGRGMLGGGELQAQERELGDATLGSILGGYRDIDIKKAQTDRADELAALGASNDFLNAQASRASELYRTGLAGQELQESLRQAEAGDRFKTAALQSELERAQADERYRGWESGLKAGEFGIRQRESNRADLQQALDFGFKNRGVDLDDTYRNRELDLLDRYRNSQTDLQRELGTAGIGVDRDRLSEQRRQFDAGYKLDWSRFLNDMLMGRSQLGLDYGKLQQQMQQGMFDFLGRTL